MSATGRNIEGNERHANDFYETPGWCTRVLLPHLERNVTRKERFATILDPGAGTGAIAREVHAFFKWASVWGIEQDSASYLNARLTETPRLEFWHGDFFKVKKAPFTGERFDLVIGNPPYNNAERFAEHALQIGRTVALLLRINWLASKKRAPFHRAHPADLFVLPKRPSFTNGGTDATEYAWFVWGPTDVEECPNGGFRGNRWRLLDIANEIATAR